MDEKDDVHNINLNQFPNCFSRQDYHHLGLTDIDIEFWGLDKPGAPSPQAAGFVILDILDGEYGDDIEP